jgi:WD40 repeat protein
MPAPLTHHLLALLMTQPVTPAEPTDRYGDPLPYGAVARLGTARLRHTNTVTAVAFLPDGRSLLAADGRGKLILWDVKTGQRLRQVADFWEGLADVALAPDGKTAIVAAAGPVALWDVDGGKEVRRFDQHPMGSLAVAVSPDGRIVAGTDGNDLAFWDRATGRFLRLIPHSPDELPLPAGHYTALRGDWLLALSDDPAALVSSPRGVFLWDVPSGVLRLRLPGPDEKAAPARAIGFTPDGREFAVADADGLGIVFRDTRTGRDLRRAEAVARVLRLAISPDGKALAASDTSGGLTVWDAVTGRERLRLPRAGLDRPGALTFSPDGRLLAAASGWRVRLWQTATGKEVGVPDGHNGPVRAVAYSPDGKMVATGISDGAIHIWDSDTANPLRRWRGHPEDVWALAFAPGGRSLASGGEDGTVRLWDAATGKEVRRLLKTDEERVRALAFAPDGHAIAAGSHEAVFLLDPHTGKQLQRIDDLEGHVYCLSWSLDARALAAGSSQGTFVWRRGRPTGYGLTRQFTSRGCNLSATFSPDGRTVVWSGLRGAVRLKDAETGQVAREIRTDDEANDSFARAAVAVFSPDGRMLALREIGAGTVVLVETATGAERRRLKGHNGSLSAFAISPGGRTLVTGGDDSTALVWDLFAPPRRRPAVSDALWQALESPDARHAFDAMATLVASPREAVALLAGELLPAEPVDPGRLARLIADLDSDDFATRETASADLEAADCQAASVLRKALKGNPSPEAKYRLEALLARMPSGAAPPGRLRQARALEVLEHADAAEATAYLRRLAKGAPDAWLTREAKASLKRVEGR